MFAGRAVRLAGLVVGAALALVAVATALLLVFTSRRLQPLPQEQPVVRLEEGLVRGYAGLTVYGFPYVSFSGIPYAEPPVGPRRFKEAEPKRPWDGVLDALEEGSPCAQVNDAGVYLGSEDCLYLNVYTPQLPNDTASADPLKVMVWIHGGGFVQGEGGRAQFGPDFLVERGVIVVTLNYRLGVLGFLSLENELAPGNLGLKDQHLALRWVRRNIRAFGGDPDDVTLFGESAGAASVHYHLLSGMSKGLFSRAIAQSGSALSPWAFCAAPRQRALSLAASLGLPGGSSDRQLLEFLSQLPAERLLSDTKAALSDRDRRRLFNFVFVPSVEPAVAGAFLTQEPAALMAQGLSRSLPYLTGVLSAECNFFTSVTVSGSLSTNESLRNFNENFEAIIGPDLRLRDVSDQKAAAALIRKFYYGEEEITRLHDVTTGKMLTDLYFEEGIDAVVHNMVENGSEPLYYYRFSYKGPNSAVPDQQGVPHADDLKYVFLDNRGGQNLDQTSDEGQIRDRIITMWTNFAKYGDPTPNETSHLIPKWEAFTKQNSAFLDINVELNMESSLDKEQMAFWHGILPP
ncbi:cholinesterase 1-like isoform X1 [Schistocerca nitens]|uniref:cholinesterase 1-like isoform X1 n=1 Tax=Schistocerca nitens TaxID=7011 RepID=UPI002117D3B1|nr:cholinesterase 1-like isoform X1 [Schistocerca nitens]